ncbi:MAG: DUF2157 domain-containing protein [bacterium]|nr:DUF2157 domain-containing protein [bacterium]
MMRKKAFWKKLKKESPKWIEADIIDTGQQQAILSRYAPRKHDIPRRLPAIMIGLAVILLSVGIIMFYAANWRKMPPAFRLIQVFLLMFATYGLCYYFEVVRQDSQKIGRAFLFLGMISYGAGIVLTAQVFHISAHPTNGVLAWCLGVLAMSWVMQDRWGYYLAALLTFIWHLWEYFEYGNPNYLFILFPLVLGYLFYKKQAAIGVLVATLQFLIYYYQLNVYWLEQLSLAHNELSVFFWHSIPFGLILIALGRLEGQNRTLSLTSRILTVWGWISIFSPLLLLSWPGQTFGARYPFFRLDILSVEYLLLLILAAGLWYFLARRGAEYRLPAACLTFALLLPALPIGSISVLTIVTHLAFLLFFFGLLYSSYLHFPERKSERFLAFAFPLLMITVKCIGFLGSGLDSFEFFVAYCIGFLVFGTVCLLINQSLKLLLAQRNIEFPGQILDSLCALGGFVTLYALSFKITDQTSVFEADRVVLTLLGVFLLIALALYLFHWLKNPQRLIIFLSAIVFFSSVGVLMFSGPDVSWIAYSLIFNALLFLMTATMIYYSSRINSAKLANLAIAGCLLQLISRYFDVFWDMLSGSALFIATGLLALTGGALLERHRRSLLKNYKD